MMTKVKICGITNLDDARLSVQFGAEVLGFNFYKKSPRFITPENARRIIERLPTEVFKVGVFVNESLPNLLQTAETAGLDAIQLHGEESPEFVRELKKATDPEIIKAFRVSPAFHPETVLEYAADAILLDAFNPREHGGTGETFDWKIAEKVLTLGPKLYLAGGLNPENIRLAVERLKPYAVDVCSGVEAEKGRKDRFKLKSFFEKLGEVKLSD